MKNYLIICSLGLGLALASGCGTNGKKSEEASNAISQEDRRAQIEMDRAQLEQQRKAALDELIAAANYYEDSLGTPIYYKAETDPEFVGGNTAMNKFLKENLKFPEAAEDEGMEGTVFVDFIVAKNGEVTNVTATNHTYEAVDVSFTGEALRVVNLMPNWTPGLQNGEAVDVKFSVPITFLMN